ncbi:MAG TPA: penicillin-binding transpeptidase domain-containing protein, partial [Acidimicrobiales bacterium]|nr:penicillin-binding transpeptidase domain-containing protein [Acidimicrobiales bacterium]
RYMTLIYLGDGNTGVGAAAETYFHEPVSRLDASQAATLAGLIPAPTTRAPEEHLALAEEYRELVLKKMYQQGYLSEAQYQQALSEKLALVGGGRPVPKGATLIYPETASTSKYPAFVNYVVSWLEQHYPDSEIYGGGLRIQTTLDPSVQAAATAAVQATLSGSAYPTDMALAAVEPQTGFVPALVGGRDFGGTGPASQVNLALGGCVPEPGKGAAISVAASCWSGQGMIGGGGSGRQPGSSWKPFVLATAFQEGIPPSTVYQAPGVFEIPGCKVPAGRPATYCQVHNDEGDSPIGSESLAEATWQSTNTVYAQVAPQVGCPNVAKTAKALGVQTSYYSTPPFYYCSSYALGELGVSPLNMASAYGVFADHGQQAQPTPILEIVNSQGKVLLNNIKPLPKTTTAIPANVADNVTNVLQGVIASGTGTAAQLGRPAAGKTGTTSNTTDAWFVGYTPTLSAAVWMGNANSDATSLGPVTGHLLGGQEETFGQVYGGTWPAITWREFMSAALASVPVTSFAAPAPIITPTAAAALQARTPPTTVGIQPGQPSLQQPAPVGGPYVSPPPSPPVPAPPATTTTTTVAGSTSSSTTSTTNPVNGGGGGGGGPP